MTIWAAPLLLAYFAALPVAAVRFEAARAAPPLAFYALDSHLDRPSHRLRRAARKTWLQVVRQVGDDYRFFGFNVPRVLDPVAEPDFVVVPAEEYSANYPVRQFRIIAFALRWGLEHSSATYIVKADHDTFLCAGHLHHEFAHSRYPSKRFFMGDFWHEKGKRCRADQNFLVYTRDILEAALKDYLIDPVEVGGRKSNWAVSWAVLMRHLWSKGQLTVVDETTRFDSQQDWHDRENQSKSEAELVHPIASKIPKGYCRYKLGMHIVSKDTRVFEAIMAEGDGMLDYEATPALAPPACMDWNCSGGTWTDC